MSTLRTTYLQNEASSRPNLTLGTDGLVTDVNGVPLNAAAGRNLLHNGAMQVAQRGASTASITATGYYTADRWSTTVVTGLGTWAQSIEADAPSGSGLRKSLKMLVTTAQASPAVSALIYLDTRIEGQDAQRIAKGTGSAQQLTLSFWVKSNVTGTYIARISDQDNNRHVSAAYSVASSATWERKVITFPADTTGVLDNDNAESLRLQFWLASGTDYTSGTLATTWATVTAANAAVGQTNVAAAINNYWQVTGVQLEVGPVATPFEFEDYGTTLRKCQRYYYRVSVDARAVGYCFSTTQADICFPFPCTMRIAPTAVEQSGTAGDYAVYYTNTSATCSSVPTYVDSGKVSAITRFTVPSGLTAGQGAHGRINGANGYLGWSADL